MIQLKSNKIMRILVTNDDGFGAPGINLLEEIAGKIAEEVWVVAPLTEQSGSGHSLTLRRPLRISQHEDKKFSVNGTPSDCVLLSINHIMKNCMPDLVLSGINHGRNIGDDMTYSGTIAAAMEATLFGIPAIALSQDMSDLDHADHYGNIYRIYSSSKGYTETILKKVIANSWPENVLINVNFPSVSADDVTKIEVTHQGANKSGDEVIEHYDPRNQPYYWIGAGRFEGKSSVGSDRRALEEDAISITPISIDLTHLPTIKSLKKIFDS